MATNQELLTQLETDLGNDVKAMRTALSNKGVSASDTKLSGIAAKVNAIKITTSYNYTGTISISYPTSWTSGTFYYNGSYGTSMNGSGRAYIYVSNPGTYKITNSKTSDSYSVTFYS